MHVDCFCFLFQDGKSFFFIFLRNIHDDSAPNIVLRVTANIVFGYATWVWIADVHSKWATPLVPVSERLLRRRPAQVPGRRGVRAELQRPHQRRVRQVSEEAPPRRREDHRGAGQSRRGWAKEEIDVSRCRVRWASRTLNRCIINVTIVSAFLWNH